MLNLCRILILCFCFLFLHQGQTEESSAGDSSIKLPEQEENPDARGPIDHPEIKRALQYLSPQGNHQQCTNPRSPQFWMAQTPEGSSRSSFKDRTELEAYIDCFFGPGKPNIYTKPPVSDRKGKKKQTSPQATPHLSIQDQIELSAKAFGLPPAFVACSYLKESTLNPNALSPRDCRGIAQINDNTYPEIDLMVRGELEETPKENQQDKPNRNRRGKIVKSRQEYQEILDQQLPPDNPQNQRAIEMLMKQKTDARVKLIRHELATSWKKYFSDRGLSAPTKFTRDMVMDPTYAIPAGALYFKYLAFDLKESLPNDADKFSENPDGLQILAASSNWGPGSIRRVAKNRRSESGPAQSVDELLELLRKRAPKETINHMSAIKTCMEAGNIKRMLKRHPKETPKACFGET